MSVPSVSTTQKVQVESKLERIPLADQITEEVAVANFKRLGEFQANQWPYTMSDVMVLMVDRRWFQGMRGLVCDWSVFNATVIKLQLMFDSDSDAAEESKQKVRDCYHVAMKGLSNVIETIKQDETLHKHLCGVRVLLDRAREGFGVPSLGEIEFNEMMQRLHTSLNEEQKEIDEIPKEVVDSEESMPLIVSRSCVEANSSVSEEKRMNINAHPRGLAGQLKGFKKQRLKKAEAVKREERDTFKEILMESAVFRRASMSVNRQVTESAKCGEWARQRLQSAYPAPCQDVKLCGAWASHVSLADKLSGRFKFKVD